MASQQVATGGLSGRDRCGEVIADKYEILSLVGRGGFSVVWLAIDKRLDGKLWAVKEFRRNERDPNGDLFKQSLIAEANLMKGLDHPNIVRVADIIDTGETVFVVMDYVEGRTLSKVLKDNGRPVDQERVIGWGIQLCDALGYLHGQTPPIIYRDMKPSNVMLREDGTNEMVRLIDFGIAREYKEFHTHDTQVLGSLGYAPPEQRDPAIQTDERADIYALGATLYRLVTGHDPAKPPFIVPIREWNPQLSAGLEKIIARATQQDPAARYQSIAEMRYDLEHYQEITDEYRAALKARVNKFRNWAIAAVACLLVGIICLASRSLLDKSRYDHYVQLAEASSHEQTGPDGEPIESPAEENYRLAIETDPSRIENYQSLIEIYREDSLFTEEEEMRWISIWQANSSYIEDDPQYAKLCYDTGILYLCWYDHDHLGDASVAHTTLGSGMDNALRASTWFERAQESCEDDERMEDAFEEGEYENLDALIVVSKFYRLESQARQDGSERREYEKFWESLNEVLDGVESLSPMIQLRVYQVTYEALSSPLYLTGLMRAGVTSEQAYETLQLVVRRARALEDEATGALEPVYEQIVQGEMQASFNIEHVYGTRGGHLSQAEVES